jgi:hypothetical protein
MRSVAAGLATLHRIPLDAVARAGLSFRATVTRRAARANRRNRDRVERVWRATFSLDDHWLRLVEAQHRPRVRRPALSSSMEMHSFTTFSLTTTNSQLPGLGTRTRQLPGRRPGIHSPGDLPRHALAGIHGCLPQRLGPDVPHDAIDFYSIWSNLYMSRLSSKRHESGTAETIHGRYTDCRVCARRLCLGIRPRTPSAAHRRLQLSARAGAFTTLLPLYDLASVNGPLASASRLSNVPA